MYGNASPTPLSREELKLMLLEHLKRYPWDRVTNILGSYGVEQQIARITIEKKAKQHWS